MKTNFLSLVAMMIAIFSAPIINAQTFDWAKKFTALNNTTFIYPSKTIVDNFGNVYTLGSLDGSADFDPGVTNFTLTSNSSSQLIFIQKLNASGNFLWAKAISANTVGFLNPGGIALNNGQSNVIICGSFDTQTDFNPGAGTNNISPIGATDAFILNLDSAGNFVWVKTLQADQNSYIEAPALTIDNANNIIIATNFNGVVDFDPSANTQNLSAFNTSNSAILKLNNAGIFNWVKLLAGNGTNIINSIDVDNSNNIISAGNFDLDIDLNPDVNVANQFNSNGQNDCFINKLDALGNYVFGKTFGGTGDESIAVVKVDGLNNIITHGTFVGNCDFDPNANIFNLTTSFNSIDAFVSKLTSSGNFDWAKSFQGNIETIALGMDIDLANNIYTSGAFSGTVDFDPNTPVVNLSATGDYDVYISKLFNNGNYIYAHKIGNGGVTNGATDIFIDNITNNLHAVGIFDGNTDFNPGAPVNNLNATSGSDFEGFNLKWNQCPINNTIVNGTGCSYTLNGQTYNNNGTYLQVFALANGCDSVVTLNLTNSASNTTLNAVACNGSYSYNGITYTNAGTYILNHSNTAGCDSNTTINLTMGMPSASTSNIDACDYYVDGNNFYFVSTTFTNTYVNSTGCDSVVTVNLTINQSVYNTLNEVSCGPYTFNGQTFANSGTYSFQFSTVNGCDSIIDINLTVLPIAQTSTSFSSCGPYTFNGQTYTSSGSYLNTFQASTGCDSMVLLQLTVSPLPNNNITQSNGLLSSNAAAPTTYQWLQCDPFSIINGATIQTFTPAANGTYAVVVNLNGCKDSSICLAVTNSSISNTQFLGIAKLYPNPIDQVLNIELNTISAITHYQLTSVSGQILLDGTLNNTKLITLNTSSLSSGVYFVHINNQYGQSVFKVVKD